jgi:hypothetical protein
MGAYRRYMETTGDDSKQLEERDARLREQVVTRFGTRSHLQPKELVELLGMKTARRINAAITSGALLASSLPGCDRLRFVELDDFLAFMRSNQLNGPKPPTRRSIPRGQRAVGRGARAGRAPAAGPGVRSL